MPLHILHPEFCYHNSTFEVYWQLFKGDGYGKWGFTQDGYSPSKTPFIQNKLKKKVPALCLVRDPITAIASGINYYIFKNILQNSFEAQKDYLDISINDEKFLDGTIYFGKNIAQVSPLIIKILVIDTTELIGEITQTTMEKIAAFLSINTPTQKDKFSIKVNDTFTRCFPHRFTISKHEFMLSPFEGIFDPKDRELTYNKKDHRFYITRSYISERFPQRPLYISTPKPITITPTLYAQITDQAEAYLLQVQKLQALYDKHKLTPQAILSYLTSHPKTLKHLQSTLPDQITPISQLAPQIPKNWLYYQEFLTL
ncbi:hypothetical protein BKH46_07000 [Helicobacter sp. 12S02634-8]|uniref:DUF2972 domain-containing protein n=1 Tax=Helicobacter sp. 12S02634-8 TaxID=1476199 RepID=UPI000BA5298A|nr:DUF2972 domain-containing protein [Helicobacter sp. 12S02634-8]PAF46704.1 hypothetical protein BKH46_07000 [Helicobacter sp. 12S02634-8]